jgi:hypothetical protein
VTAGNGEGDFLRKPEPCTNAVSSRWLRQTEVGVDLDGAGLARRKEERGSGTESDTGLLVVGSPT